MSTTLTIDTPGTLTTQFDDDSGTVYSISAATVSGGDGNYTYDVSGSGEVSADPASSAFQVIAPGEYTLTVSDGVGAQATYTYSIPFPTSGATTIKRGRLYLVPGVGHFKHVPARVV